MEYLNYITLRGMSEVSPAMFEIACIQIIKWLSHLLLSTFFFNERIFTYQEIHALTISSN